jgi:hypothetical protein
MWILPLVSSAMLFSPALAPVPKFQADYTIELSINEKKSPLDDGYFAATIRNNTDVDLEIWGHPIELSKVLEFEIRNDKNEVMPNLTLPMFGARAKKVATILSGNELTIPVASHVPDLSNLKPGKYKCKATFEHRELKIKSNELAFTINQEQIDAYLATQKK